LASLVCAQATNGIKTATAGASQWSDFMALPFADESMAKGLRQLSDDKLTASLP
jgi:hypothetical protein